MKNHNRWTLKTILATLLMTCASIQLSYAESTKIMLSDNVFYNTSDLNNHSSLISNKSIDYSISSSQQFMVDEASKARLEAHAQFLKQHKEIKVLLETYTASTGSREYSLALGYKYGNALKKILISLGVPEIQIDIISHGEHVKNINRIELNYLNIINNS